MIDCPHRYSAERPVNIMRADCAHAYSAARPAATFSAVVLNGLLGDPE
jgi:hypothetical protein